MSKNLKTIFFRTDYYGAVTEGGTVSLHLGKIKGLQKLGHNVNYVSTGPMPLPDDVPLHIIRFGKLMRNFPEVLNLPFNRKFNKEFLKIMDKVQPDFIWQHHHDFNYSGAFIKRETGVPFILHADGVEYWIKKNWGKLYLANFLKWAEEIQMHNADAITCPSTALAKQIHELVGVPLEKIYPSPNGVNPDIFHPNLNGDKIISKYNLEGKFVVGYTGTFGHWHGIDILAESAKYIKKAIPNFKLFLVGDGILRPKIEEIIKRDNTQDCVLITGFIPYSQVPEYLAACDVLSTPCVNNPDSEFFNSPVKLFEYMAMQKPIAATDVGQQGEIFKHGENAMLCQEQNPKELAEIIIEIHRNKELANNISIQARKDVVEKYDWVHNAQTIVNAYNNIIKKR